MKHLLPVLSTALLTSLLLGSCVGSDTTLIPEASPPGSPAETSSETPSEPKENTATDADSDKAEGTETDANKKDNKPDTEGAEQKNVILQVENQKTVGQVTVKKVSTSRDGWVSIHQSHKDGSIVLPESIGEARVDSGESEAIVVDLWEAPEVGDKLWVLLHIDAGERGTYEFPEKDIPVKKNGETMARSFVIQGEEKKAEEAE
jgi:hypothetical protein